MDDVTVEEAKPEPAPAKKPSLWLIALGFVGAIIFPAALIVPILVVLLLGAYTVQQLQDPLVLAEGLASVSTIPWFIAVGALFTWASFFLPILIGMRRQPFRALVSWWPSGYRTYVVAALLAISLQVIFGIIGIVTERLGFDISSASNTGSFSGFSGPWIILAFIVIVLGAPFFEELFFRGLALNILKDRVGWGWSIAVTSVLFGVLHVAAASSLVGSVLLGVFTASAGVLFALLVRWSGSVKVAILAHVAFNGVAFAAIFAS